MSDEIFLDGKKYLSSRKASEVTGYAKDYVGQLCRGGKLDSKLIGRNWYVTIESLLKNKKKGKRAAKISEEEIQKYLVQQKTSRHPKTSHLVDDLKVKFFADESPLIPPVEISENKFTSTEKVEDTKGQVQENEEGSSGSNANKVTASVATDSSLPTRPENGAVNATGGRDGVAEKGVRTIKRPSFFGLAGIVVAVAMLVVLIAGAYASVGVTFRYSDGAGISSSYWYYNLLTAASMSR